MFDLVNVFSVFLPQLLLYPNPSDPLNPDAASLMLSNPKGYQERVKEYVKKYASKAINLDGEESEESTTTRSSSRSGGSSRRPVSIGSSSSSRSGDRSLIEEGSGLTSSATSTSIAIKTKSGKDTIEEEVTAGSLSGSSGSSGSSVDQKEDDEEQLSDMDDDGGLHTEGNGDGDDVGGEIGSFEMDDVNTQSELTDQMEF